MNQGKPNIVMIMADQMASNVIGSLGHFAVQTPNIDQLVERGVTFDNAYCNSPLCAPSRASLVTGKHVSNINVYDNGSELSADTPTFLHHLRKAGYETILSGKMHFVGPDQLHGFEHRVTKEIHTPTFDLTPDWTRGVYHNSGTGVKRLKEPGIMEMNNNIDYDDMVLYRTLEQIKTLKRGTDEETRPFFLCASFFHPHDPFHTTKEYWEKYDDVDIPMPKIKGEDLHRMHPFNQWIQTHHELDICELSEEEIRDNRRAYYGMVTYFDSKVGEIVNELERLDMRDDTIIIVTSDHGEMLGEHGMWFKRTFYDHATKVPLVISWPKRFEQGKRVKEVVSLVDLTATFMKVAKVPDCERWLEDLDGQSFDLLLTSNDETWKDEAVSEYFGEGTIEPMIMLRSGRYKFVYIHEHSPLLFDLEDDPDELKNLVQEKAYKHIRDEFESRINSLYDFKQIKRNIIKSQQERLLVADSLKIGKVTSWNHVPYKEKW